MASELLFVYGSLQKRARVSMHHLMAASVEYLGAGSVQGRLYSLGDYPGLVSSESPEDRVHGEVYALRETRRLLWRLDAWEGCRDSDPHPHAYRRVRRAVQLANGDCREAWLYECIQPVEETRRILSGHWL